MAQTLVVPWHSALVRVEQKSISEFLFRKWDTTVSQIANLLLKMSAMDLHNTVLRTTPF